MLDKRARIIRLIHKNMRDAERIGENFDALVAEVKETYYPAPLSTYEVPAEYAEQFKKFVADNKDRRQTIYPWFDVVAFGLGLNPDKSLYDADRERMTEKEFEMPDNEGRYARRLLHESTAWFPPKK
jgi:hypothetical protein